MAEHLLLSASVEVLLQKIISVATENINLVFGSSQESSCLNAMMNLFCHSRETDLVQAIREELVKLEGSLSTIQAMSLDNMWLQDKGETIKLWLQKLGDLAYDADDALADFSYKILQHEVKIQNQMKGKVGFSSSHSDDKAFRQEMMPKARDINNKLEMINKEVKDFVISEKYAVTTASPPQRDASQEAGSLIADPKIIGREKDVSKIVEMLISTNNLVLSVISVVGISGLGKTTLAQSIYNDSRTSKNFDRRSWAYMSGNFKAKKILKLILESLTTEIVGSTESRADLVSNLKRELESNRYLLVLDGMSNVKPEKWDQIRETLADISRRKGNIVLVLTHSEGEASSISTLSPHLLEKLSPEHCWSILKEKAGVDGEASTGFEEIGMQIAEKCQGLPLAANLLGGLLHNKGRDFWLSTLESGILDAEEIVLQVTKLIFDNLPSAFLKRCFAFCSMFSRNSVIKREQLVQLWIAEGFVDPQRGSDVLEEVGNQYLDILLQSSLLQATSRDKYNNVTHCKMHNLVHDFASSLSRYESINFGESVRDKKPEIRHLALESSGKKTMKIAKEKARHLQTLFLNSKVPKNTLLDFNNLYVLNLCRADIKELPALFGKLTKLQYLDLSRTEIKSLPDSLCNLYMLQTLSIIGCKSLEKLPENFKNLLSLRHLHFYSDEFFHMPFEIGRLTNLQTLPIYNVGEKHGPPIGELSRLKNLQGKLEIRNLDLVKGKKEANQADLKGKLNLQELELRWIDCWSREDNDNWSREGKNNDENVLEGLEPHPNLKSLRIEYFMGGRFPSWVMKMSVGIDFKGGSSRLNNLVEVKLHHCERCKEIPTLGLLPLLQYLELRDLVEIRCIGPSFYDDNGSSSSNNDIQVTKNLFPALKILVIEKMTHLVDWMGPEEISSTYEVKVFPRLVSLSVINCPELTAAPGHFPSLKELSIESINSSSPFEKICSTKHTTLTNLQIDGINELTCLPDGILENIPNLARLHIKSCNSLTRIFPHKLGGNTSLQELVITNCRALNEFPADIDSLQSLEKLQISSCHSLESLPTLSGHGGLRSLRSLEISSCHGLVSIPSEMLESCKSLQSLRVRFCKDLKEFSPNFQQMPNISLLDISHCPMLNSMPKELYVLSNLVDLEIGDLSYSMEITCFTGLQQLSSLLSLSLYGQPHWDTLPVELQHLTALKELSLWYFGVKALPEWIEKLSSIQELKVCYFHKLQSFPPKEIMKGLKKLKKLSISDCHLLERKWKQQTGPDSEWFKVSHIKKIFLANREFDAPEFWALNPTFEDTEKLNKTTNKLKKKKKKNSKKKTQPSSSTL